MICIHLDAAASFLSFLGGLVLAVDALGAPRRAKVKYGEQVFQMLRTRDRDGSPEELEFWFAGVSYRMALFGVGLITAGFLVDVFTKVLDNPLLFSLG